MILFVFEGKKTEPNLFKTMEKLYFPNDTESVICCFGYNIYELYRLMNESDFTEDIVSVIRNKWNSKDDNSLRGIVDSSDFSEVFLFFDYDFQNKNISLAEMNGQIHVMLDFFCNETENGKLYINYPMVEAIKCTEKLPDQNFKSYKVARTDCKNFKDYVTQKYSFYKSMDFLTIPCDGKTGRFRNIPKERLDKLKRNWEFLKVQHISKANYICSENYRIPSDKNDVSQLNIFISQLQKYVSAKDEISILCAYPLFLFEYMR